MNINDKVMIAKKFTSKGLPITISMRESLGVQSFINIEALIKKLSTVQLLECLKFAEETQNFLLQKDLNHELLQILCENASLGYMSIYKNEKQLFKSPLELLNLVQIEEIINIYNQYAFCQECYRSSMSVVN